VSSPPRKGVIRAMAIKDEIQALDELRVISIRAQCVMETQLGDCDDCKHFIACSAAFFAAKKALQGKEGGHAISKAKRNNLQKVHMGR
jgi:hypothetical protein